MRQVNNLPTIHMKEKYKNIIKFSSIIFVIGFLFFCNTGKAFAATRTWDGSTSGAWSVASNWSGDVAPVTGDDLVFPSGTSNKSNTNDLTENTIINSITFTDSGYTLSGNPIILGPGLAGITDSVSSGGNTIALDIRLDNTSPILRDIIVTNTAETLTISGRIAGVGGFNKEGTGTLILSGANTYGGTTKINAGVISARNSTALGTIAAGTEVVGGAALELQGTINISYEALALRGYGVSGGGALRNVSDNNTYGGLITLSSAAGTEISSDSGTLTITGGTTGNFPLVFDGSGNMAFSKAPLAGSGAITKNGAGTVTLNFPNTNTGAWTINAGTILYGVDNAILSSAITVTGGTLDIATYSDMVGTVTLGTLDLANGTITGTTGMLSSLTWTVYNGTISAIIAGQAGALTKNTTGTVVLTRANQYTGATTISAGILEVQDNYSLGLIDGITTVSAGATLQINGDGLSIPEYITFSGTGHLYTGAIRNKTGDNTLTGLLTMGAASMIESDTGTTLTIDGKGVYAVTYGLTIGGLGDTVFTNDAPIYGTSATLVKNDSGTLTLQAFNNFTGATNFNGGEVVLSGDGAIPMSTSMTISAGATLTLDNTSSTTVVDRLANSLALTMNGGNLEFIGSSSASMDETVGVLTSGIATQSGNNTITVNPGSGGSTTLQFASLTRTAGSSLLFRGTSFGSTPGAGVSTLLFTTAPTLTGGAGLENTTTISIIAGAIGDNSLSGTGTDMVTYGRGNGYGLRLLNGAGFSGEYASDFSTANANVKLTASTAASTISINSIVLSGSGGISNPGSGQVVTVASGNILNTVSSATIAGANTTIAGGSVELQIFAPSNITISSLVTTTGGLTKSGAGILTFSTAKTYTGLTSVNGGTLLYGIDNAISSGNVTVNGGILDIATYNDTVGAVILQNGTITGSTGVLTGTSYNFREGTVSAIIAGSVAVTRIATNTALDSVVTVTRDNTYTGTTTITSGILKLGGAGGGTNTPLGIAGAGSETLIASGGALDLNGYTLGTAEAISSLAGTGFGTSGSSNMGAIMNSSVSSVSYSGNLTLTAAARINADAGAMTISGNASGNFALTFGGFSDITYSGVRSGTSTIVKVGINTLTLSNGNSSYSGATTISEGTVKLGAVSVGGTNSPLGTTSGATTVATGSRLDLNGYSLGIAEPLTLSGVGYGLGDFASGALMNSSGSSVTFTGLITLGAASTIIANSGDINLTAAGTITGSGNALTLGGSGTGTLSSIVGTVAGTLTKIGTGTWTISGQSTYTGATAVNLGILKLGASGGATNTPIGTNAGGVTVYTGAVFDFNTYTIPTTEAFTINGRGINDGGAIIGSSGTFGGTIAQATDSRITNASGTMTITGAVSGAFALYIGGAGNITTSAVFPAVALSITKQGEGTLTVTGANLYTGETRVQAGTFAYAASTTLVGTNLVVQGGTFDNGANTDTIGTVTLVDGIINNSAALTAATSYTLEKGTISGIIAGAIPVTKNTNNTVRWTGVNTISSTTAINAGTLLINSSGSAVSTTITINLGGTLTLDNAATAVASRLGDALALTMNGGNFNFIGNTAGASSETTGALTLSTGHNTITITPGSGGSTTMTFTSLSRSTGATALFRGTNFGNAAGANVSTLLFNSATLTGAGGAEGTTTMSIIKGAFGDGSLTGTGSDMVTVVSTKLRLLTSGEYSSTLTTNTNVKLTGNTAANTVSINSLVLNGYDITDPGGARTLTMGSASLAGNILINSANNIAGSNTTIAFSTLELPVLATNTSTISAVLNTAASGPLIISGTGNVTLSAANAYTGTTYVNGATLTAGASNVISSGGVTVIGGTYNLSGYSDTVGAISLTAGTITTGAGTLTGNGTFATNTDANYASIITGNLGLGANATFTIGDGLMDNDAVISAVISGSQTFAKAGNGVLELSGSNTFSGAATISAGVLRLGAAGGGTNTPLGTTAGGTTVSGASSALDLNGYTLGTAEGLTLSGALATGALQNTSSTAVSYSGQIILGASSTIISNYGDINITATGNITGTYNLTIGGAGNGSLASNLNTSTGTLTKNGYGVWTISGGASTFTGLTTVSVGTLKLGSAGSGSNTPLGTSAGGVTVTSGAVFDLNGYTLATAEPIGSLNGTGLASIGAFINSSNSSVSYSGAITLGAASRVVNHGSGLMTLSGNISGNFALTVVTVGNFTQSTNSIWSGSGTLVKEGSGTLILSGQNTMTGAMTVSTGTLQLGASGGATNTPLGTSAGGVTVSAGAVLDLSTYNLGGASTYETLNLSGTGIKNGGVLISSASSGTTNFGAMTVAASSIVTNSAAGTIAFTGLITIANSINFWVNGSGPTTISAAFGASATSATLTKDGAGTLTISAATAALTGLVRINGGTLAYGIADALNTQAVTVAGGTWDLKGFSEGGTTLIGAVTLIDGSIVNTGGAATIASSATYTVEKGTISAVLAGGAIAMNKNSGGTVTLSAANTFTGLTTINAGILSWGINDALSSGSLTITGGFADLTTRTDTVATVTLTSGGITSSTGILTGTSYALASGTVSGILAGAVNVSKTTAGTVTMSGTNTYSGTTTITTGTLRTTSTGGLGDGSNGNTLIFAGGTLQAGGDITSPGTRGVTLTTTPVVDTNGYTVTFAGTVGSAAGLTKNGTGTLSLTGATTLAGALAINNGTLSQGNSLSGPTSVAVASSGVWSNVGTGGVTLAGNVTNSGTITFNSNNGALCVDGANSILIRSSVNNTTRSWANGSTGAGTFNMYNLDVDDMTGSLVTAYTSTLSGDTTWTAGTCGVNVAGTANGNNGATVKVAINGSVQGQTTTIGGGTWTISNITQPSVNDIITVWVDNVADNLESTGITKWSSGSITGMVLNTNVLTIGSNQNTSLSTTNLGLCDFDTGCADEDIMHSSSGGGLTVDASSAYTGETLSVLASNTLTVASGSSESISTEKISNAGTITATGTPTITLSGASGTLFTNTGTFTPDSSSTVISGNGDATINSASVTFYDLTSNGTGVKSLGGDMQINHNMTISSGTFNPTTSYQVLASGTNTLSVTGTLRVHHSTFEEDYSGFDTVTFNTGSTTDYTLNGSQTISSTVSPYYNLTASTGGTKTVESWPASLSSWPYRKSITVNKTVVSNTNQTNFPLLIYLVTDSSLSSYAQSDGDDIVFTDSSGTVLDHEIEKYVTGTGELEAWVEIPTLSASSNTTIFMYYGNSGASNQQNPTGVWDSDYKGVWHLPNGSTLSALDSTGNNYDGTITTPTATTGQVDGAATFNGTSDRIAIGQTETVRTNGTISGWVYITGTPDANFGTIFAADISTGLEATPYVRFYVNPDRTPRLKIGSNNSPITITGGTTLSLNTWYHLSSTISGNGSSSNINLYVNGVSDATQVSGSHDSIDVGNKYTSIGALDYLHSNSTWLAFTQGKIDEVHVSNAVRSLDWIKTEYNNQLNPASYQFVGPHTAASSSVTVNNNLVVSAGTLQTGTANLTVTGTSSITGTMDDNSTTGTVAFTGGVTLNSGGTWTSTGNESYSFAGGLTIDSGSTFTSGSGTYTFQTNAQTLGGTKTGVTITNVTNNISSGNGLTLEDDGISITTLTQGTSGVLTIPSTVPTITTLTATASPNTVQYTGSGQTIKGTTYHHLTTNSGSTNTLGAATIVNGTMTVSGGAFATADYSLSADTMAVSGSATVTLGSSTITLTGTGTAWNYTSSGAVTAGTSTILFQENTGTATAKTFAGNGKTYNNITLASATSGSSTGSITFSGDNTFASFSDTNTAAHTLIFTASSTTTVTSFNIESATSSVITMQSSTPTSYWNLVDTSGTNQVRYVSITDSCASGGATWDAYTYTADNTNGGHNCGWVFTAGISIAGTANGNDAATVKVAINGSVQGQTGTISAFAWTISGVSSPSVNDIITVWVDGVSDANESSAVTKWSSGNITGMVLNTNILTIGSNQDTSLSLTNIDAYSCADDEDVMHSVISNVLNTEGQTCAGSVNNSYTAETLATLSGDTLTTATSETVTTEKINNAGTITASGNSVFNLAGTSGTLYTNTGTFTEGTSTVNFTGNGTAVLNSAMETFYNVVSSGTGTKSLGANMTINNSLAISAGTLADAGANIIGSGTPTLSVSSGATLSIQTDFPSNFTNGNISLNVASTVEYNSGGAQTVSSVPTYGNLTTSEGSQVLNGATAVAGNLTISSGTLQLSSFGISVTGTTGISGTLADDNITGTNLFIGAVTINSGGVWDASVDAPFEFRGGLTNNSSSGFTSGSGIYTFSTNAQTLSGTQAFTIETVSDNISSGNGLTISTQYPTITDLSQEEDSILTFSGTVPTITNAYLANTDATTQYTGTGQTVKGTNYNHLIISSSGTDTLGGTINVAGNLSITSGALQLSSQSISVTGTTSITGTLNDNNYSGVNYFYGNVTINSGGIWTTTNNPDFYFDGNFTNNSSSGFTSGYGEYRFNGSNAQTLSGTQSFTIESVRNSNTNGTNGLILSGANPTITQLTQDNNKILTFSGVVPTISTLTASTDGNTVQYTGTTQTIIATDYHHLKTANSGVKTLGGDVGVRGDLTIGANSTFNPTVNYAVTGMATDNLIIDGTALVYKDGFIQNYNTFASVTANTGSTVDYYLNGNQTIDSTIAYDSLNVSNGGTKTIDGATAVNANVTVGAGATLSTNGYLITATGTNTLSVSGTLEVFGTNFTDSYTGFDTRTLNAGSTVNYSDGIAQNIDNTLSYVNLTTSGDGVKTLAGNTTITGNAIIGNSTTLNPTSSYTLTGSGTNALTNNGTIRVMHSTFAGSYPSFETKTLTSGTVDYYLGGTQTVDSTLSYGNIKISTSGTKTLDGAITATGVLTLAGGTLSSGSHYTMNLGSIAMTGGTFTPGDAQINLSGTGTVFNYSSGTYTRSGETINITDSTASSKTFAGGGRTFWNLNFTGTGTGELIISGNNTFNELRITNPPHTIKFTAGTTQNVKHPKLSGISGSLNVLNSTTNTNTWTINLIPDSNGYVYEQEFLSLRDSTATGNSYFSEIYAGSSTNTANNNGWTFSVRTRGGGSGVESSANPDNPQGGGGQGGGGGAEGGQGEGGQGGGGQGGGGGDSE